MKNVILFATMLISALATRAHAGSPLACNLGVLTVSERKEHAALTQKILDAVTGRDATADGYAFHFDRKRVSIAMLGQWIEMEARCCPFMDFALNSRREGGPLTLRLGGRNGVREFLASEFTRSSQHP